MGWLSWSVYLKHGTSRKWHSASRDKIKIIEWWICQKLQFWLYLFPLWDMIGGSTMVIIKGQQLLCIECSGSFRNFLATSVSFVKTFPEESHRDVIRKRKNNRGSKRPENYANIAILLLLLLICQAVSNSRRNLFIGKLLKPNLFSRAKTISLSFINRKTEISDRIL